MIKKRVLFTLIVLIHFFGFKLKGMNFENSMELEEVKDTTTFIPLVLSAAPMTVTDLFQAESGMETIDDSPKRCYAIPESAPQKNPPLMTSNEYAVMLQLIHTATGTSTSDEKAKIEFKIPAPKVPTKKKHKKKISSEEDILSAEEQIESISSQILCLKGLANLIQNTGTATLGHLNGAKPMHGNSASYASHASKIS